MTSLYYTKRRSQSVCPPPAWFVMFFCRAVFCRISQYVKQLDSFGLEVSAGHSFSHRYDNDNERLN